MRYMNNILIRMERTASKSMNQEQLKQLEEDLTKFLKEHIKSKYNLKTFNAFVNESGRMEFSINYARPRGTLEDALNNQ